MYNSGDTCIINEDIVNKFNNNEIDYIYHEVSNDGYKAHMDIDVLASALKKNRDTQKEMIKISSPKDIASLLINEMVNLKQEVFKLILLNTKNIVIGTKDIFKGTLNSSIVHPREVFKEAIQRGSANVIVCHNHPSGDPSPSKEDIDITIRLKECGNIIGIGLLDHIIIGNNKYVSLKEKGII